MKRIVPIATQLSWGLLVFFLPVTSFPWLSKVMGGTDVAPLSAVFLVILVLVWFLPRIFRGGGIPQQSVPLLIFFLLALVSSLLAFFLPIPSFKGEPLWKNELPSIITLGVGVCFYLVISLWISDEAKLTVFFRIVNISGGIALAYTLIQAVFVMVLHRTPEVLIQFQNMVSASHTLFIDRVNGLAFEPSWLAHQLNMFYIPIWLGLSIKKISVHKFRLFKISIENILLAISLIVLFLSFSRIGWLAFLAYFAYLFLRFMDSLRQKVFHKITNQPNKSRSTKFKKILFSIVFWFLFILILQAILIFAGWVLTKLDSRMGELFNIQGMLSWGLLGWTSKLGFAERVSYWIAGFGVFLKYPIFGVGLGNSGFFIPQTMISFSYSLTEILRVFLSNSFLPNPKNLWVRILAETGIVGFSVFISWLWVHWKTARSDEKSSSKLAQAVGITGQIALIGLVFEGFSLDTFALPYYWMTLGLVVAAQRIFTVKSSNSKQEVISQVS